MVSVFIRRLLTAAIGGPLFLITYVHAPLLFTVGMLGVAFYIAAIECPQLRPPGTPRSLWRILTFLYPTLPLIYAAVVPSILSPTHALWGLYPYAIAWAADTGGYVIGKLWGRNKLVPQLSPGKTWEGFVGSGCAVFGLNYALFTPSVGLFLFSGLIFLIAVAGDLIVSFFKRKRKLKDTGDVLPGHGGLLDRFDSVAAASLFLAFCTLL